MDKDERKSVQRDPFKENVKSVSELDDTEKDTRLYIVGSGLECNSPVLASQIKNFAPSVNIVPIEKSSIALPIRRASEASQASLHKRSVLPETLSKIQDRFAASSKPYGSISSQVNVEEDLARDAEVDAEMILDDDVIRDFPVSIQEKRRRRSTIYVPERKLSWKKKLITFYRIFHSRFSQFELWNEHLKTIEGRFGAGVVSYFLFIRWLLYMNMIILLTTFIFLVMPQFAFVQEPHVHTNFSYINSSRFPDYETVYTYLKKMRMHPDIDELRFQSVEEIEDDLFLNPEMLTDTLVSNSSKPKANNTKISVEDIIGLCHDIYMKEIAQSKSNTFFARIQHFLQGTGYLEPTLLFSGRYSPSGLTFLGLNYHVPLAFVWVFIILAIVCLIMMIKYSSTGIQEAFLTRNDIEGFTNQVFGAWDYCVRTKKACSLQQDSFSTQIKSSLSEVRSRKEVEERSTSTWAKLYFIRIFINLIVFLWIGLCYKVIYETVMYQLKEFKTKTLRVSGFRTLVIQYLPTSVVVVVANLSPFFFNFLASFEGHYGQTLVNLSIIRNVFLTLSSVIVLVSSFHQQITCSPRDICGGGKSVSCRTPRCWETYVGQQLYKLNLIGAFLAIAIFALFEIPRDYLVRKYDNKYTKLLGRGIFVLPLEVLIPIYGQTILWLGMLYSPLLPVISVLKLIILFYIKKAKVLKYSDPPRVLYRASRFNSTFMNVLMCSFLAVVITHLYTVVQIRPSLGCGPFRYYNSIIENLQEALDIFPEAVHFVNFVFSGWFFLPASLLTCAIIQHYWKYVNYLEQTEFKLKTDLVLISKDNRFMLRKIEALAK